MQNLLEIPSARSLSGGRQRKFTFFRSLRSHSARVVIVSGLTLIGVAASWVGIRYWEGRSGEMPNPGSVGTTTGRLTMSEMAAMAVIGGIQAPEKPKLPNSLRPPEGGAGVPPGEQAIIKVLENGSEAEALVAIRKLAALGGALNHQRLAAIMKDTRWPDALRTAAAQELVASDNPAEAKFAVQSLAVIGGEANTDSLNAMINNTALPQPLRLEAALGMAIIATPRARDALINAFRVFPQPEVHEQLVGALGQFPFSQTETTWKQVLGDPNTPDEVRVAAVDALSNSTPEALPFLKTMAASDRDPEVREMSAWAISALDGEGDETMGPELARMAHKESEADVRRRLYEALPGQVNNPAESLLSLIRSETNTAARVAGFNALGDAVKRGASSGFTAEFDSQIVPELEKIAVSPGSLNIRMRAAFALRRANTPVARQALETVSQTPNPKIAMAARQWLQTLK